MKAGIALALAAASFAGARVARSAANAAQPPEVTATPYAPSPSSARIVSLGYRELLADLLYVRMVGYFAAYDSSPSDTGAVAEAIVALDPQLRRTYEFGAIALTDARREPSQALQLRATELLDRGMREFPTYWKFPFLAGQIYIADLATTDPVQRRAWDERGTALLESASRKPNAPNDVAVTAAQLQSKLGQKQRAISSLTEILLITRDADSRARILEQLGKINAEQSDELAAELLDAKLTFDTAWKKGRTTVPPTMFVLVGPPLGTTFDLADLATGGRDLIGARGFERLEPLTDPPTSESAAPLDAGATSADGPSNP